MSADEQMAIGERLGVLLRYVRTASLGFTHVGSLTFVSFLLGRGYCRRLRHNRRRVVFE